MEKINIKISFNTLETVCNLYDAVFEYHACYPSEIQFKKDYKAAKNIVDLLVVRLKKKLLTKKNTNKGLKMSLEYYEAYFLINFISANSTFLYGIYEKNLLLKLTSELSQEL